MLNHRRATRMREASAILRAWPPRFAVLAPALASLLASITGCAPAPRHRDVGFCDPPSRHLVTIDADPPPPAGAPRVERFAALLGLTETLATMRAGESPSLEARVRALDRIVLARTAIASLAAELHCEGERAEQAAAHLEARADRSQRVLTIASIVVGAGTGVASAALSSASSALQIGVAAGGGVTSAGLGLGSLWVHPTMEYLHPRNLLADLWNGPSTSTVYPPLVWAYLTRPEFPTTGGPSIRANVVRRWRELGNPGSDAATLFGPGGVYDADALRARAGMLDQVRAEVMLLDQEVAELGAALLGRD